MRGDPDAIRAPVYSEVKSDRRFENELIKRFSGQYRSTLRVGPYKLAIARRTGE